MEIAGFKVSKNVIIGICVFVGIVIAFAGSSYLRKQKEVKEKLQEEQKKIEEAERLAKQGEDIDTDAILQESLVEKYGEAPEGFYWSVTGELIAEGTDSMSAEDITYTYMRALSILDFSTAQKYSRDSSVINTYKDYYGVVTNKITDYYDNFLRKQYKTALTTIEVEDVKDTSVFADGSETVTLRIKSLDLTDKDFWRDDAEEIFQTMRVYDETETDSTKKMEYVYDYILKCYEDGTVGKKENDIEIVVSKDNGGGWVVSNDQELNALLGYEWGVDSAEYIDKCYQEWLLERHTGEIEEKVRQDKENITDNQESLYDEED